MTDKIDIANVGQEQVNQNSEYKRRGREFEEYVVNFLKKLHFQDVKGADEGFKIGGHQIDVIGGHDDILFVFECKTNQSLGKKDKITTLKNYITKFKGKFADIKLGIRKHDLYSKYKHVYFLIGIKNFSMIKDVVGFANQGDRLYVCDANFFEYYEDLFNKIGKYAQFNLLGEIGVRPREEGVLEIPALRSKFDGKVEMFSFMIDPRILIEFCYVARRELGHERYYQRILDGDRIKNIANFLNSGDELLANNIIIAFDDKLNDYVEFLSVSGKDKTHQGLKNLSSIGVDTGYLKFPKSYRSCWIIDGQHRLYSFKDVDKIINVPIVAFRNFPIDKQCKIFLDINKFQKPVAPDLVWDLNGDMQKDSSDGIISRTVKQLNATGILANSIYIPSLGFRKKQSLLKMAGLCNSLRRAKLGANGTISKVVNPYYDAISDKFVHKISRGLDLYFDVVKGLFYKNWDLGDKGFILTDGGISVFIYLFEKIVSHLKECPTKQDFVKYLTGVKNLFDIKYSDQDYLKELREKGASEGGKSGILREFIIQIRMFTKEKHFGGAVDLLDESWYTKIEAKLQEFIKDVLSQGVESDEDYYKGKIPETIYGSRMKRLQGNFENLYREFTLGDCITIVKNNKTLYSGYFVGIKGGFSSLTALDAALDHISSARNNWGTTHSNERSLGVGDYTILEGYLDKINYCLGQYYSEPEAISEE